MKSLFTALLFLTLISPVRAASITTNNCQVYFSPKGGCTEAIVQTLQAATNSVLVQAYSFTRKSIAKALVDAKNRGVNVQVILDKSQRTEKYSSATFLFNNGIPTYIDAKHAIAHNKIMVIDSHIVITGSFNFTRQAEVENAENLLVIDDAGLASKYTENWKLHLEYSQPYLGLGERNPVKPQFLE